MRARQFLMLCFLLACGRDVVDNKDAVRATRSCGWDSESHLTGEGIARVRIGLRVDDLLRQCTIVADTIERGAEGELQRAIRVRLGPGVVAAEIVDSAVWRLVVSDSVYRTEDGLGVGSTLEGLLAAQPEWAANGETGVFVGLETHCGLSFRLDRRTPGNPKPWIVRDVEDLRRAPPSTPVDQVLVIGSARCVKQPA